MAVFLIVFVLSFVVAGLHVYLDIATPLTLIALLAYSRFIARTQTG